MRRNINATPHRRLSAWVCLCVVLSAIFWMGHVQAARTIHKCVAADGKVTYQGDACTSAEPGGRPTVEQLNRERRQKLAKAAAASQPVPASAVPTAPVRLPATAASPQPDAGSAAADRVPKPAAAYRCDGRRYCSQMRSCDEAKYFLAHCPGVKMDGDGDGIPCEEQWCATR